MCDLYVEICIVNDFDLFHAVTFLLAVVDMV